MFCRVCGCIKADAVVVMHVVISIEVKKRFVVISNSSKCNEFLL